MIGTENGGRSVKYATNGIRIKVDAVHFVPIEFLAWECLTIGALGWGQIQIANANHILITETSRRKPWMLDLCDIMLEFYPREIGKISERIKHFERVKEFWRAKPET